MKTRLTWRPTWPLTFLALVAWSCTSSDFAGSSGGNAGGKSADEKRLATEDEDDESRTDRASNSKDDGDDGDDEDEDGDEDLGSNIGDVEMDGDGDVACEDPLVDEGGQTKSGFGGKVYQLPQGTGRLPTDFASMTPVGQVQADNLNIPARDWTSGFPGVPNLVEWFAIVFQARLSISESGKYEFKTVSDDGSKVYVDGDVVVDNDGTHAPTSKIGVSKELKKGRHKLKVEWFQGPRKQIALQVFWRKVGAGTDFQLVDGSTVSFIKDCDLQDLGEFQ